MMNNTKKVRRLGFLGFVLCGLCCALPVIGAAIGMASLTGIAVYLEKISIVVISLTAFFLWYGWYSRHKSSRILQTCSCKTNCDCKTDTIVKNNNGNLYH